MPEHRCERPPDELPNDRRCCGSGRSSGVAPSISLTIGQRCPDYSAQRLVAGAFTAEGEIEYRNAGMHMDRDGVTVVRTYRQQGPRCLDHLYDLLPGLQEYAEAKLAKIGQNGELALAA